MKIIKINNYKIESVVIDDGAEKSIKLKDRTADLISRNFNRGFKGFKEFADEISRKLKVER
jgi:hypothetical protein